MFADVSAIGQRTERSIDGVIVNDVWVTRSGDYPKTSVETKRCSEVIREIVQARAVDQRGVHPGEADPLHP